MGELYNKLTTSTSLTAVAAVMTRTRWGGMAVRGRYDEGEEKARLVMIFGVPKKNNALRKFPLWLFFFFMFRDRLNNLPRWQNPIFCQVLLVPTLEVDLNDPSSSLLIFIVCFVKWCGNYEVDPSSKNSVIRVF